MWKSNAIFYCNLLVKLILFVVSWNLYTFQALNHIGLRVVLDTVYNHLQGNGPFDEHSVLDKVRNYRNCFFMLRVLYRTIYGQNMCL